MGIGSIAQPHTCQPTSVPGPRLGAGDTDGSDGAIPRALSLVVTAAKHVEGGRLARDVVGWPSVGMSLVISSVLSLCPKRTHSLPVLVRSQAGPWALRQQLFSVKLHLRS